MVSDKELGFGAVVVANPGSMHWLKFMGASLAEAGMLRKYVTPIGTATPRAPQGSHPLWNSVLGRRLESELRRRQLPAALTSRLVGHAASGLEVLSVACGRNRRLRFGLSLSQWLRNTVFDERVARKLKPTDAAFIGSTGAALRSFAECRRHDIVRFLDYPIAHHRFSQALLHEEARLQPDYADTLQYHVFSPRRQKHLESEIAEADIVFVLSPFQKRTFVDAGIDERKLVLTPLGVDLELFRPEALQPEDDSFRVLFIGQVTQRKGISYLCKGFQDADIPGSQLLVVGQPVGDPKPWIGSPGLQHIPASPRWMLPRLYNSADVFVAPSLVEGFMNTALEAMACGMAVILSENTGVADFISDGVEGFVVPIRDSGAIADRLRYLKDHPAERMRMGRAARTRAEQFSWESYGAGVVRYLQLELKCRKGRPGLP